MVLVHVTGRGATHAACSSVLCEQRVVYAEEREKQPELTLTLTLALALALTLTLTLTRSARSSRS